ncbi:MAG: hypothetical protein IPL08_10625 [Saprospiraceae bacterium]|nr:hypothetical protein [Saprospiraceae bacterium]
MDGTVLDLGELSTGAYEAKSPKIVKVKIYRSFRKIIFEHATAIELPIPKVMRRVNGYPGMSLSIQISGNLAKIFCRLRRKPRHHPKAKVNCNHAKIQSFTVHYDDRMRAIREVHQMIACSPAAIEMLRLQCV